MKRKLWAALALAFLAVLAGCASAPVVELSPDATVEGTADDGGEYVVDLSAELWRTTGTDPTVREVQVVAYDMTGSEVCRADVGDLETTWYGSSTGSERVLCDGFPSILALSADEMTDGEGGDPNGGDVKFYLGVYVGQGEGDEILGWEIEPGPHQYETAEHETYSFGDGHDPALSPAVDDGTVAFAKCRQYVSDRDFSELEGEPPWVQQDPEPPEVDRRYRLSVTETRVSDDADPPTRSLHELPPLSRDLIEDGFDDSRNLTRSEYLREHDGMVDWSVEDEGDVPDDDGDSREVSTWNESKADCREFAYDGTEGHEVDYVVVVDGQAWRIELTRYDDWSGEIDVPTVDEDEHRDEENDGAATIEPVVAR